jgi:2-phospho-L-lactate guanylyltransferase
MAWTVVVPLKGAAERKTRLAPALDATRRRELSDALYRHVIGCIAASGIAGEIIAVSPVLPEADTAVRLWVQQDSNLNAEFERIRAATAGPLMVVNADLPLLQAGELVTLAGAAGRTGCAIAPDRHRTGTNAVALLPDAAFAFAFGPQSLKLHLASAHDRAWVVGSAGLGYDLDTMADIEAIKRLGQPLPPDVARLLHITGDKGVRAALAAGD